MKVLFVTVGHSPGPLVQTIKEQTPDYVYFICSKTTANERGSDILVDGEGIVFEQNPNPKYPLSDNQRESLVKQTGLTKGNYETLIILPDDPSDIFEKAYLAMDKEHKKGNEIVVDFTGGTKSMSAGIVLATMENPSWKLTVVTGRRVTPFKIETGLGMVRQLSARRVQIHRQLSQWEMFLATRDYRSALTVLKNMSLEGYVEGDEDFEYRYYLTSALDEWDRFNYEAALGFLRVFPQEGEIKEYEKTLELIVNTYDSFLNTWKTDNDILPPRMEELGFILVYDTLTNALRRAEHGRFDDAVSRMYRAIEMYGQFCLMTGSPRFRSNKVELDRLPDEVKERYPRNRKSIRVSSVQTFELLALLGHPVATVWAEYEGKLKGNLSLRNHSFLAHGFNPIVEMDFNIFKDLVWDFISKCDEVLGFEKGLKDYKQLPNKLKK